MQKMRYYFLFVVILCGKLFAGDETRSSRAYANKIIPAAFIETYDDKYPGAAGYTNYSNRCIVELGLDEDKHAGTGVARKIYVKFDMVVTDLSQVVTYYTNRELEINYNPLEQTRYQDKAQMVFPNANKVRVYNIRIYTCGLGVGNSFCTVPYKEPDVYVQAEITTTRFYNFGFASTFGVSDISDVTKATDRELEINWDYVVGAEEYELEYTYVDNYSKSLAVPLPDASIEYDLDHNSTRITTTGNTYRIPLTYERGYIVYRLRPIGRNASNVPIQGTWDGAPATGSVNGTSYKELITPLNNDALNWRAEKTFAENGKFSAGVVFSDALGNERQNLIRSGTDKKTIAQATLYDFYGRPVVNILPSPVPGLDFNYRFGLNKYKSGPMASPQEFDKNVFDQVLGSNLCVAAGFSIDAQSSTGASFYYSSFNTDKSAYQGYIPVADGFPYTQVKLRPDAQNKITSITIPGKTHQLTSGKEIKHFYAKPTQVELDRLFGSEAPKATHCFKDYVIDQNGQMSTVYIDERGRTIATALVGNPPFNVDALPNLPTSQLFTENMIVAPNNHKDTANKCIEVNTTFLVTNANETQDYLYKTTLGQFGDPVCTPNLCYDCVYSLEISIKDDCGNEIFDYDLTASPAKDFKGDIGGSGPPYTAGSCTGPTTMQITGGALNTPITLTFPRVGTYSLYKKICVSDAPIDDYVAAFAANQVCLDPCYYVDSLMSLPDFASGCGPKTCQDCMESISGTANSYMDKYPNNATYRGLFDLETGLPLDTTYKGPICPSPTPQQLSEWYEGCDAICQPTTVCQKYEKMLLADFYPGSGQYAANNASDPNSIMNLTNTLFSGFDFQTPTNYQNANGAADFVQINGAYVSPQSLTSAQYIQNYKKSWAKAFIQKHPEYCKSYFYCNVIGNSLEYDEKMKGVDHYDTVCTNIGLMFPLGTIPGTIIAPPAAACAVVSQDPLFTAYTNAHPIFGTLITNFKNELLANLYTNTGKSIYEYVAKQFYTTLPGGYKFGQDECNRDLMWQQFRAIYLVKKQALYQALYAAYLTNPTSFGLPAGVNCAAVVPNGYTKHFQDLNTSISNLNSMFPQVGAQSTSNAINNLINTNQQAAALALQANVVAAYNATMAAGCASTCASYTVLWHSNLNTACPNYSALTVSNPALQAKIIAALQGVCEKGCDINNQLGASTTPVGQGFTIPAYTSLVSPYTNYPSVVAYSFQDVLTHFGLNCNAAIITQPQPYPFNTGGANPTSKNNLTSCKCDQILELSSTFTTLAAGNNLPAGVTQEWQYFKYVNGYDLKEYYALKCLCLGAIAKDVGNPWSPSITWTQPQVNELALYPIGVEPKLTCGACIKCSDVATAIDGLSLPNSSYPDVIEGITQDSVNTYYALAELNTQFGTHSLKFYIDLYSDCKSFTATATFSNNITEEALDLFHYLNELVQNKNIEKTNRLLSICKDDKFYLSSLYKGNLPTIAPLTYNYTPGNPLNFTIKDASLNILLSVNLTLPSGTWSNITSLNNFVAWCPSPVAGPNYSFKVDATTNSFNTITITGQVMNAAFPISKLSSGAGPKPMACPKKPKKKNTCAITAINNALTQGQIRYNDQLQNLIANFIGNYRQHCFQAVTETFTRKYNFAKEYNYTLYYYDEAGNIQRVVAPEGVTPLSITSNLTSTQYPLHSSSVNGVSQKYMTEFKFNAFDEPVSGASIDGGAFKYLYDNLGRLIASQNAKQAAIAGSNYYSYTLYDALGRITEVGQMSTPTNLFATANVNSMVYPTFASYVAAGTTVKKEITKTFYDVLPGGLSANATTYFGVVANQPANLRNRVSCIYYIDDPAITGTNYDNATFYSYDDHGYITSVVHENNTLPTQLSGVSPSFNMKIKKVNYEYDLLSGNIIKAVYQENKPDQFAHKYFYDDDNRLHEVFTSKDNINWDRDAKYFYYEHGPVARVELADKHVQGRDYYFTIHGWIKGINSDALKVNNDVGKDGAFSNVYTTNYADIHAWFAKDAMSFALNYYNVGANNMDYTAIKSANYNGTNDLNPNASLSNLYNSMTSPSLYLDNGSGTGDGASLYNGNISSMVTSFIDKAQNNTIPNYTPFPQLTAYRYDQLSRITAMKAHRSISNNAWTAATGVTYDDSYRMNFSYDNNGNLLTLFRNGAHPNLKPGSNLAMDNLSYKYIKNPPAAVNANQLYAITDQVASTNHTDDVDGPTTAPAYSAGNNRYNYDEVGNLKNDAGEYIQSIEWTADRKVRKITRNATAMLATGTGPTSVTKPDIEYQYNAMHHRVLKIVKPRNVSDKQLTPWYNWIYTYYSYDASGNVMAVYNRVVTQIPSGQYVDKISLGEHHIYGSTRLALSRPSNEQSSWSYTFSICGTPQIPCNIVVPPGDGDPPPSGNKTSSGTTNAGPIPPPQPPTEPVGTLNYARLLGYKEFELNNHIENVIATVSDRKVEIWGNDSINCNFTSGLNGFNNWGPISVISGSLAYSTNTQYDGATRYFPTVPGKKYRVRFKLYNPSGTLIEAEVYPVPVVPPFIINIVANQYQNEFIFTATTNQSLLRIQKADPPWSPYTYTYWMDDVIIDEMVDYGPDLLMHTDYYPYGQQMAGRTWAVSDYRYSHSGHEKEDALFAGAQSAEYWMYDARIGRRWERDPLVYAWQSPYAAFNNNPVYFSDPAGLKGDGNGGDGGGSKGGKNTPERKGSATRQLDGTLVYHKRTENKQSSGSPKGGDSKAGGNNGGGGGGRDATKNASTKSKPTTTTKTESSKDAKAPWFSFKYGNTPGNVDNPPFLKQIYGDQSYKLYNTKYKEHPNSKFRIDEPNTFLQFQGRISGHLEWSVLAMKQKIAPFGDNYKIEAPSAVEFGVAFRRRLLGNRNFNLSYDVSATFGPTYGAPFYTDVPSEQKQDGIDFTGLTFKGGQTERYMVVGWGATVVGRLDATVGRYFTMFAAVNIHHMQGTTVNTDRGGQKINHIGTAELTIGAGFTFGTKKK